MSIFSSEIQERDNKPSPYIGTDEFFGKKWQIKGCEIIVSKNIKYGANEKDALFTSGILKEGETLRYSFADETGLERIYDSKGMSFYLGFKNAEDVVDNDWVTISAEGKGDTRRYTVKKV